MRAFDNAGYAALPRHPNELMSWINLFESGEVRASVPRLIILDGQVLDSGLLRTLRGRSPWSGIPTLVHGSSVLADQSEHWYRAGISAFCVEPDPEQLEDWAQSLARYWSRVAVLPSPRLREA